MTDSTRHTDLRFPSRKVLKMLTVWVHSPSQLVAEALGDLVSSLGYRVQFEEGPAAELALWDLTCYERPYPPSPNVPTLALLRGNEDNLVQEDLWSLGYQGYLQGGDGEAALKRALEALVRREELPWERRAPEELKLFG